MTQAEEHHDARAEPAEAGSLPAKQELALRAVISHPTLKEAALAAGISEPTLWRCGTPSSRAAFSRRLRAAWEWAVDHDEALKARAKQRRERARRAQPHRAQGAYRCERKDGPGEKLYDKLTAEYTAAIERVRGRLAARYGEEPFADMIARFEAIRHVDRKDLCGEQGVWWRVPTGEMMALESEERAWLRCAEAERVVLGEALALTPERAADCDRRAVPMIEEARRKYEEEKAEQERRHREFLERSREFSEKERASAPASPGPVVTPTAAATAQRRAVDATAVADAPAPRPQA